VVEAAATTVRPASLADLAVIVAGSVAAAALAEGRSVGLIADDGRRRLVRPGAGSRQLWRILGELVDCAPSGALSLAELLGAELAGRGNLSGASVVVITGDLGAAWLGALTGAAGGRPAGSAALLVAPSASAAAPCEAALASAGVAARSFEFGASLPLASPPRRRVAARVSPLGRIIKLT
jgi:hypothetical protein